MKKLQKCQEFDKAGLKPDNQLFYKKVGGYNESLDFDMHQSQDGLIVDFVNTVRTDHNKWQQPNVVCDKVLHRYLFAQPLLDAGLKPKKLADYIRQFRNPEKLDFDFDAFETLAQKSKNLRVSLPVGIYNLAETPRKYVNTFLPVIVQIDGYDLSQSFSDYDKFGPERVSMVFDSLVNGQVPEMKNDLFNREEIISMAREFN